jgi:hypothetical protein
VFVIRGSFEALEPAFREALSKVTFAVKHARVEPTVRAHPWSVGGQPALSLAASTRVTYARDVMTYAQALAKPADLVGLTAADRTSSLEGDIVKVIGTLAQQRARLFGLSQRGDMRDLIRDAPDDAWVLRIEAKGEHYDYVAPALDLLVTMSTLSRYDVKTQEVENALNLSPSVRAQLVKAVADIAKAHTLIGDAYSERNAPQFFASAMPKLGILWGMDRARMYDRARLGADFTQHGVQRRLSRFQTEPVRIVVLNALGEDADIFLEALRRDLERTHKFSLEIVRERKIKVASPENLESAVRALVKVEADTLLAFLPDDTRVSAVRAPDDAFVKAQAVARALPSLILHTAAIHDPDAMPHVIMGLLARAGNAPFIFEEPLPYADLIVGLAIERVTKKDGDHLTALARLYNNRGQALGWRAARVLVQVGDTLTEAMLARLLPRREIEARRILIHHQGRLRQNDLSALMAWEAANDAAIYPVEIITQGAPRLYSFANKRIDIPLPGSAFLLNEREALLATAAPNPGTPPPLHVRSLGALKLNHALDSIAALLLLNHGTMEKPRLPVTLVQGEDFTAAIMRGVFPEAESGERAWWL